MGPKEFAVARIAGCRVAASLLRFDYTHDDTVKAFRALSVGSSIKDRKARIHLPGKTARQLPDQSTLWVDSSSTRDPRLRSVKRRGVPTPIRTLSH